MIYGTYYLSGTSTAKSAFAIEEGKERIVVICSHSHRLLVDATPSEFTTGLNLPGQAVDVEFPDGSVFTPNSATFRWRHLTKGQSMVSRLETSLPFILASLILIPSLFYVIHSVILPQTASYLVHVISDETKNQIGKRSYKSISNLSMSPTGLTSVEEARVRELWEETLQALSLPSEDYTLRLHDAPNVGANAFALPDGTIIVTDELVRLYEGHPDRLRAVMLHELGHVQFEHGLQLAIRSLASTLLLSALIGGDLNGISEALLGTGNTLLQASFSRDMEREADAYARDALRSLGTSPAELGYALEALSHSTNEASEYLNQVLNYLSTHPALDERVHEAIEAGTQWEKLTQSDHDR